MRASARIAQIREHVEKVHYLTGSAADAFAISVYLDEQQGFAIPGDHALRLAEKAAGVPRLAQVVR